MSGTVLITGATGSVNKWVVPQLRSKGASVRALVRDPAKAKALKDAGCELAVGDFTSPDTFGAALKGAETVFLVTPPHPQAEQFATRFIEAARSTSKPRIVRLSVYGATANGPTDNTRQHGRTDQALIESGLAFSILRPNFFMQNLFMAGETIAKQGSMYWGMGEGRLAMVDVRDVADCAVSALLDPTWDGGIYELTGPEAITFHQVAATLTKGLGREVKYMPIPPEAVAKSLQEMKMGDWFAGVMADYSRAYAAHWGARRSGLVQRLSGHPPRSLEVFVKEVLAPAFKR